MNKIAGHIHEIQSNNNLSLVRVSVSQNHYLNAVVIETPQTADYLQKGRKIHLVFKETEIILAAANCDSLSIVNQIPATIAAIDQGSILSRVLVDWEGGRMTSIIGSAGVENMALHKGMKVSILVPFNQIMLQKS